MVQLDDLLRTAVDRGASDLHIKAGSRPMMRVYGQLQPAADEVLTASATAKIAAAILPETVPDHFSRAQDIDFAYRVSGLGRFRCNVYQQRGSVSIVLRVIPRHVPTFEELLLPPVIRTLADEERGLILVTGVSGSGKSTTLAAMVQHINETRSTNIITIEDPIEYLHRDVKSIVSQREVSVDTRSFAQALRSSLRQDPDVILVGEMRDQETIETALLAAETGHLVLSTLHTIDASETVNRIVSVFAPHHQPQVRLQLAGVLRAVISQRLMPRSDVPGRVPAVEVMVVTPYIRDCIVDPEKIRNIAPAIAGGGSQYGMQTFDQSVYEHHQAGRVSYEEALRWASRVDEFKMRVQGIAVAMDAVAEGDSSRRSDGSGDVVHLGQ